MNVGADINAAWNDIRNFLNNYSPEQLMNYLQQTGMHYPGMTQPEMVDRASQALHQAGYRVSPQGLTHISQMQPTKLSWWEQFKQMFVPRQSSPRSTPVAARPPSPRPASQSMQLPTRPLSPRPASFATRPPSPRLMSQPAPLSPRPASLATRPPSPRPISQSMQLPTRPPSPRIISQPARPLSPRPASFSQPPSSYRLSQPAPLSPSRARLSQRPQFQEPFPQ